jgi:hypothetical protein
MAALLASTFVDANDPKKLKKKKKLENFTKDPRTSARFELPLLNLKNSQFTLLKFQLFSI